jgi:hypothetical protein
LLCPAEKKLRVNLEIHLNGIKLARALQDAAAKIAPSALSTSRKGRPPLLTRGLGTNQPRVFASYGAYF